MLEKTGALVLTEEELIQAKSGTVPDRISKSWGLSLSELEGIIRSGNYKTTGQTDPDSLNNFENNY